MPFPTLPFAVFFLLVGTLAWAARRRRTLQKLVLLLGSWFFYARWDTRLLALLVGASLANYALGELIVRTPSPRLRRGWLTLGVLANLGLLGTFKFYEFFREHANELSVWMGLGAHLPVLEMLLAAGISFYTFQGIAYLVDTHRGTAVRPNTLLDFLLFMAFFPKLLAGPICRSDELMAQINGPAPREIEAPSEAMTLLASGLFKKLVLASYLGTHLVEDAFEIPGNYSSIELVIAVLAYTSEIYLDFSGYTDMARGLALLLGFRLPENFRYPYAATNIGEFWRRWHITFSRWLRDYVYFPLGGSHGSRWRTAANLMVTFLVCGLWHGARWGFVLWGLMHGIALAGYKLSVDVRRDRARARGVTYQPSQALAWKVLGCVLTVGFCAFARIFFRATDLTRASEMLSGIFALRPLARPLDPVLLLFAASGYALCFFGRPLFDACVRFHERAVPAARPLLWGAVVLLALVLKTRDVSPYIYFGF